MDVEFAGQHGFKGGNFPLLFHAVGRHIAIDQTADHVGAHVAGVFADIGFGQDVVALVIDDFALVVGNVVVFQNLLAHIEVAAFYFALGAFDLAGENAGFDGDAALGGETVENRGGTIKRKQAQQRVFKRQVKTAGAGVALTAGAAAQLVVDAAAFVALGADDVQAAGFEHAAVVFFPAVFQRADLRFFFVVRQVFIVADGIALVLDVAAEHDVGASAGHIGGDGNHAGFARLCHNQRFALVFFGVEHIVRQAGLIKQARHQLGVFDGGGADQYRLAFFVAGLDVFDHRFVFFFGGAEDLVVVVFALDRAVGGDDHGFQIVDVLEFVGFGIGGTGHARELGVKTEVVLEGDGCQRLVFALDFNAFFGFHRLVQTVRPAAAVHQAAGVFVHNHDFAVFDHIVLVEMEQVVGAQGGHQVVHQHDVGGGIQRIAFFEQTHADQDVFGVLVTGFAQDHLMGFFIDPEIAVAVFFLLARQQRRHLVHHLVELDVVVGLAGNNQRRARFVDQNRVYFVHHGEIQLALHFVVLVGHHIVAQVVEAELVVGAVGDIGVVGGLAVERLLVAENHAHAQAEKAVERLHNAGVALG